MTATDQTLHEIVCDWAASINASVSVSEATSGGPPAIVVRPANVYAAPITLWVADDDASVSFAVGSGLWFDAAVPLEASAIRALLGAVAAGDVNEYVRKLFGRVVARRGSVGVDGRRRLTHGEINPFSIIPGIQCSPSIGCRTRSEVTTMPNNTLELTVGHRGRFVLAMDCVLGETQWQRCPAAQLGR